MSPSQHEIPDRGAIARMLREAALLLDIDGRNRYRARAYEDGARAIEATAENLGQLVREKRLTSLPKIGPGLAAAISEIVETGELRLLEDLRAQIRPGVVELSRIPGLTPRRLEAIQAGLGIESVEELRSACEKGMVRQLVGFGEKTERKLLEAIRIHEESGESMLLPRAMEVARAVLDHVRAIPGCAQAEAAGALRRSAELVEEIVIVAAFADPSGAWERVVRFRLTARVESEDRRGGVMRLADGARVRVRIVTPEGMADELHQATGSERHLRRLEELSRAATRGAKSPGRRGSDGRAGDEAAIYSSLGLPFIPPELREDGGEIEAALAGETFDDLVAISDVKGMTHCHTTASDGRNSIEEMARAAHAHGMEYITITDHSPSAGYAGGLDVDRLKRQWDEIDRVQESVPITILKGTESDILADGSLDYPDEILERLDVVIASIHMRHKMDADAMTARLVRAMRQPVFKIWGHALGRLLKRRAPIPCRVDEVLDAIAGARAAIEINGDPHRMDLPPEWVREARKRSIRFVISTDAHSVWELANLRHGVAMARRGGVRAGEVLNALDARGFARAVRPGAPG